MFDKRISIFTGHFGSGKTEVAVNYAARLSEMYDKTAIVDFDIVNPFFRTADVKQELENKGIWVITPRYANTNVDVPALPSEINTVFEKRELRAVFDVGGDDVGARALSRYNEQILSEAYEMFLVVNIRRIMTDTIEKIEEMIYEIEGTSRLKVTSLVNNSNLLQATTSEDLLEGQDMILKIADRFHLPIAFASGFKQVIEPVRERLGCDVLYLDKYIRLPWE